MPSSLKVNAHLCGRYFLAFSQQCDAEDYEGNAQKQHPVSERQHQQENGKGAQQQHGESYLPVFAATASFFSLPFRYAALVILSVHIIHPASCYEAAVYIVHVLFASL